MANVFEPTEKEKKSYARWCAKRPPAIRAIAERLPPWKLYRMGDTGSRVTLHSFSEGPPVTVTVNITGEYNSVLFERQVFGIDPNDLTECDLPDAGDPVGVMLDDKQAEEYIEAVRAARLHTH